MRPLKLTLMIGFLLVASAASAAPPAKVSDLAWMSGHWEGPVRKINVLEENWTHPHVDTITSLVRERKADGTELIEMIIIHEEEGSLTLRLQQWNPDYSLRMPSPHVMRLSEIGPQKVVFEAVTEGLFKTLGYSRDGNTFTITVTTAKGGGQVFLTGK